MMKKIHHTKSNQKRAGVAMLISNKLEETKIVTKDKYFIMIKKSYSIKKI